MKNLSSCQNKSLLVIHLTLIAIICVEKIESTDAPTDNSKNITYGYQPGEVTQGIGYGHHLHPFYYRGKAKKFYNCAIEDDWNPVAETKPDYISAAATEVKPQKNPLPPKKYNPFIKKEVTKYPAIIKNKPKLSPRTFFTRQMRYQKPNFYPNIKKSYYDYRYEGDYRLKRDHEKLVRDINSLSENPPVFKRYKTEDSFVAMESQRSPLFHSQNEEMFYNIDAYVPDGFRTTPRPNTENWSPNSVRGVNIKNMGSLLNHADRQMTHNAVSNSGAYSRVQTNNADKQVPHNSGTYSRGQTNPGAVGQPQNNIRMGRQTPCKPKLNFFQQLLLFFPNIF